MFDDLKQQNNQNGPVPQNQAVPPQAPQPQAPNQPLADMFADVDPVAQANQNMAGRPSAVQSGKIKPVSNTSYMPGQQASPLDPMMFSETGNGNKLNKIIIILVVILLVLALGAGAYYLIAVKGKIKAPVNENQNTNETANINTDNNENIEEVNTTDSDSDGLTDEEESQHLTNALLADTDGDELSDREEVKTYKTDPLAMDSDLDGLNDGEEIKVWSTDPLVVDSDNDTYPDGTEVKNGYNPNGPGKLATTTPGIVIDNPENTILAAAKLWGANLSTNITLCRNAANNASLTNYLAGADMCNPKINQNWPSTPDSYPKVCVLDKVIQDNTWTIALQSNSPDVLSSVVCNQTTCQEAPPADYPNGKVCP